MNFNVHESSASRIVRKVEDIFIHSGKFDLPRKLPHGKPEDINWSAIIIDATETLIERPKKQSEYYSGKKKQYTLKARIIVHWQTGPILDKQTCKGSIHDFNLYKQTCPNWLPQNTNYLADIG